MVCYERVWSVGVRRKGDFTLTLKPSFPFIGISETFNVVANQPFPYMLLPPLAQTPPGLIRQLQQQQQQQAGGAAGGGAAKKPPSLSPAQATARRRAAAVHFVREALR